MSDVGGTRHPLVLASASPRRAQLLERLSLDVEIRPPDIDEAQPTTAGAGSIVEALALRKAEAVHRGDEVVLGADTMVFVDGHQLGKPVDGDDAARMLAMLSGRTHLVLTGVAVRVGDPARVESATVGTHVTFVELTDADVDWYVATGEPRDKAGAYGIQGVGGLFVARVEGSYSNVVGLPLHTVRELLARLDLDLLAWRR